MDNEDDILAAKAGIKSAWLSRQGVTGMDVGFKYVGGKRTTDVAIRLFVRKKLADIESAERFPSMIGQHKTDVIEGEFKPYGLPDTAYYNPMVGGVMLFVPGAFTTAGMFVRDNATGQLMILSTFHGDIAPGTPIYQPGDTGQPDGTNGRIGYLIRSGHNLTPPVDADVFSFDVKRDINFIIEQLGCVKGVRTVGMSDLGMAVTKRGVTSGVTHGSLDGISGSVIERTDQGKVFTYDNVLSFAGDPTTMEPLCQPGDSGSVILDSNNHAVATESGGYTYQATGPSDFGPAFPDILAALNVTPCYCGTKLPLELVLTNEEYASLPPTGGSGSGILGEGNSPNPIWNQTSSGVVTIPATPSEPSRTYKWTTHNIYQSLTFRASVAGFIQPVFSWKINGQQVNSLTTDFDGNFVANAAIFKYPLNSPVPQTSNGVTPITLQVGAYHEASYDIKGTYGVMDIAPTTVQGHVLFSVEVEVQEQHDHNTNAAYTNLAMLDTQQTTWMEILANPIGGPKLPGHSQKP